MFCFGCEILELESKVFVGVPFVSAVTTRPFYDEEGRCHFHDPGLVSHLCRCSNGHEWEESSLRRCWCGWPGPVEATKKVEPEKDWKIYPTGTGAIGFGGVSHTGGNMP